MQLHVQLVIPVHPMVNSHQEDQKDLDLKNLMETQGKREAHLRLAKQERKGIHPMKKNQDQEDHQITMTMTLIPQSSTAAHVAKA